ncbi:MAG TPA: hypothetical protein VE685_11045 [Thermoanaerobaculia bacterium]|nr:hypothetical protein [Thermoanaerobaculia bacterium]
MTVAPPQAPPPAKKGLSPLAWVAIGCGGIAVLGILVVGGLVMAGGLFAKKQLDKFEKNPAVAAAELIVRANPELELVESDPEAGTLTIRNTKTGEVVTMNAEDIQEGKLTVTTKDGTSSVDFSGGEDGGSMTVTNEKGETATFSAGGSAPTGFPAWVPAYPGGAPQGMFQIDSQQERGASFTVQTSDAADRVLGFYKSKLEEGGFTVESSSFETSGNVAGGTVTGTSGDQKRTVNVIVSTQEGQGAQAVVSYSEKP